MPAARKNNTATTLMATITALKRADSRTPTTSRIMISNTMITAGRLMMPTGGAAPIAIGNSMPNPAIRRCM